MPRRWPVATVTLVWPRLIAFAAAARIPPVAGSSAATERTGGRPAAQTGRRLHAAASALLTAVDAARFTIEVTPEMVAVAAITELGDSIRPDSARRHR